MKYLFIKKKNKVEPNVQGSRFCRVKERWLVGNLTPNFGEIYSWFGVNFFIYKNKGKKYSFSPQNFGQVLDLKCYFLIIKKF